MRGGGGGATENGTGKAAAAAGGGAGAAASGGAGGGAAAAGAGEVSSTLLAQELPAEVDEDMLLVLFGRFGGFKELRMAGQRGIAFIEVRAWVGVGV